MIMSDDDDDDYSHSVLTWGGGRGLSCGGSVQSKLLGDPLHVVGELSIDAVEVSSSTSICKWACW